MTSRATRLGSEPTVTKGRTSRVLPHPSIESSQHPGGGAVSKRHKPPRSGAVTRRYHGRNHERDRRRVAGGADCSKIFLEFVVVFKARGLERPGRIRAAVRGAC